MPVPGAADHAVNDRNTLLHVLALFGRDGPVSQHFTVSAMPSVSVEQRVADLLAVGADINAVNADGLTPLELAWTRNPEGGAAVAASLLAHGADLRAPDRLGYTAMHRAAARGDLPVLRTMLDILPSADHRAAFINDTGNADEKSVIEMVWEQGADLPDRAAIISLLLQEGANLGLLDQAGDSLLHRAVKKNNFAVASGLLEAGVSPQLEVRPRLPFNYVAPVLALDLAAEHATDGRMIDLLVCNHAGDERPSQKTLDQALFRAAADNPNPAVVLALIKAGANARLGEPQVRGGLYLPSSALHQAAAFNRNVEVMRAILGTGRDIDERDHAGRTPLFWATMNGSDDIAACLIAGGANPELQDDAGQAPIALLYQRALRQQQRQQQELQQGG